MSPSQDPHTPRIDLLCLAASALGQVVLYVPPNHQAPDGHKGRAVTVVDPRGGAR